MTTDKVPESKMWLNTPYFPHILDRIVELSSPSSLLALRGVNRSLKAASDARLTSHIIADFASEQGPDQWSYKSYLGGTLPIKLTYRDLSAPHISTLAERQSIALLNDQGVVIAPDASVSYPTCHHYALSCAGGLEVPEVLSLKVHSYGDQRMNATFPASFGAELRILRAHCGRRGRISVPNWAGHQEAPHLLGWPAVEKVILFAEIGHRSSWGVAAPYTASVDETGMKVAATYKPPPSTGFLKVVNTIRLLPDADGNSRTFDNGALVRNVDPEARYEYVFIFVAEEPSQRALWQRVGHELGVLSCILVSLDWNVARNPVTFVGVDRIDPRLLGLPVGTKRSEVEAKIRANVKARSQKQVHIAQMLHADPEGLPGFADRIRFLTHEEYRAEVGEKDYDLEVRWEAPVQVL